MKSKQLVSLLVSFSFFLIVGCSRQSSFERALSYQGDAEYGRAIEYYNISIRKGERVAESEKNVGDIYFGDKKYKDAFAYYKKSIETDPNVALKTVMRYISYNDAQVRDLVGVIFSKLENQQTINQINSSLNEILKSGDQYKILDALAVIAKMGEKCTPILKDIVNLLDGNNIINQKVLEILPTFANVISNEDFEKVLDLLSKNDEIIKPLTIECFGNMKEKGTRALPPLLNILANEGRYKSQAKSAIEKIGRPEQWQMKEIYSFVKDKPKDVKLIVLNTIDKHCEGCNGYVPSLMYFLNDNDPEIKQVTRNILSKIGNASPESVSELIKLLDEPNEEIVSRAVYELGDLGNVASDAKEPLKKIAETTKNKDIKKLATDAIQKIQ